MASHATDAQIELHMHLLRQWMIPTPPAASYDMFNCYSPSYCQTQPESHDDHLDPFSMPFDAASLLPNQRLQSVTSCPQFSFEDFPQDHWTPAPDLSEVNCFDDAMSIYSETPSSYLSSEYSEFPSVEVTTAQWASRSRQLSETPLGSLDLSMGTPPQPTTEVDALMLALRPASQTSSATSQSNSLKKHSCPFPQCDKSFSQLTHLKIHTRAHTGEKPYVCSISSCSRSFSQLGNLRTHERRHTGQKPNRNSGNSMRDRAQSSASAGRYECRLDDCAGKPFTQLGNLKSHQNKFHKQTLVELSNQLAMGARGPDLSGNHDDDERRKLREYFESLYKNCNKGIKGRGKGRKVELVV